LAFTRRKTAGLGTSPAVSDALSPRATSRHLPRLSRSTAGRILEEKEFPMGIVKVVIFIVSHGFRLDLGLLEWEISLG